MNTLNFEIDLPIQLNGNCLSYDEIEKILSPNTKIKKETQIIVFCMSGHPFKTSLGFHLQKSGITLRSKKREEIEYSSKIAGKILKAFENCILLVSYETKKKLSTISSFAKLKHRIFCYNPQQKGSYLITNKLPKRKKTIRRKNKFRL